MDYHFLLFQAHHDMLLSLDHGIVYTSHNCADRTTKSLSFGEGLSVIKHTYTSDLSLFLVYLICMKEQAERAL
jgi:hypothetical protein